MSADGSSSRVNGTSEERPRSTSNLGPDGWSRPATLLPQLCADDVSQALNDYRLAQLRVNEAGPIHRDAELANAVAALADRPTLPDAPLLSYAAAMPSDRATDVHQDAGDE